MKIFGRIHYKLSHSKASNSNKSATIGLAMILLAFLVVAAGCGDSDSDTSTTAGAAIGGETRPAPGVVELLDARSDISAADTVSQAPTWLDISWASIAKEGENQKFSLDVAGKLPETMQSGLLAAELGFLLDVDKDGTPDWGIYGTFTKTGWLSGLYNQKTKERLADANFPGTFSHDGTTLTFTINPDKFGSPASFRWFAYTDAGLVTSADGGVSKAGDRIGDQFQPGDSSNWPEYP